MKKSQITIFIILGILIFAAFAFLIYLKSRFAETQLGTQQEKFLSKFDTASVKNYIQKCLDQSSTEAIGKISKQGGFFFNSQLPFIDFNITAYNFNYNNLPYNVTVLERRSPLNRDPPLYPCSIHRSTTYCQNWNWTHLTQIAFSQLGQPEKPKIYPEVCSKSIINPGLNFSCSVRCEKDSEYCNYSIEEQLEHFINKTINECINISMLEEEIGLDIIPIGSSVDVIFSDKYIQIILNYPVRIGIGNEFAYTTRQFISVKEIPLKKIYEVVLDNLFKDAQNFAWNIVNNIKIQMVNNSFHDPVVTRNATKNGTVVIIQDKESKLRGFDFVFMFARQNRIPALDNYQRNNPNPNPALYDQAVMENDTIFIDPYAFDPDEDKVSYIFYDGWYVSYKPKWNQTAKEWQIEPINPPDRTNNPWVNSRPYKNGCYNIYTGENDTNRCAELKVDKDDVGIQNLTIMACDEKGECDWQNLKIMVADYPLAEFEVQTIYGTKGVASLEDPVILNGTINKIRFGPLEYKWYDYNESTFLNLPYSLGREIIKIPFSPEYNPLVPNITKRQGYFNKTDLHKIELKVRSQYFSVEHNVSDYVPVHQCLSYNSNQAPYPFSRLNETWLILNKTYAENDSYIYTQINPFKQPLSPYFGNHTCCLNNQLLGNNFQCYQRIEFGCYANLTKNIDDINQALGKNYKPPFITPEKANDVYKRTMNASCPKNRGNLCDLSSINLNIEHVQDCDDCQFCEAGKHVCQNKTCNERRVCKIFLGKSYETEVASSFVYLVQTIMFHPKENNKAYYVRVKECSGGTTCQYIDNPNCDCCYDATDTGYTKPKCDIDVSPKDLICDNSQSRQNQNVFYYDGYYYRNLGDLFDESYLNFHSVICTEKGPAQDTSLTHMIYASNPDSLQSIEIPVPLSSFFCACVSDWKISMNPSSYLRIAAYVDYDNQIIENNEYDNFRESLKSDQNLLLDHGFEPFISDFISNDADYDRCKNDYTAIEEYDQENSEYITFKCPEECAEVPANFGFKGVACVIPNNCRDNIQPLCVTHEFVDEDENTVTKTYTVPNQCTLDMIKEKIGGNIKSQSYGFCR